ncbi:MAG: CBS domain-containing protein [Acidobacteria bacterium]|nr:CBS domain-containing protein [Acidobacteriota bacterium]
MAVICPGCEFENVAGDELCAGCGQDLLDAGVPSPRGGMQGRILSDPLSALRPVAPIVVAPDASAAEALRLMKERRHGSVLVVEGGVLAGIFTERDVLLKLAGRDLDPATVKVGALMTAAPAALHEDDPLAYAIHLMAVRGVRHVPIVREGRPVGLVSIRGVLAYLTESAEAPAREPARS